MNIWDDEPRFLRSRFCEIGSAIGAVASIAGGAIAAGGARSAASTQAEAARESTEVQREALGFSREVYERGYSDLASYRAAGDIALGGLADLFLPGGANRLERETASAGNNLASFTSTPWRGGRIEVGQVTPGQFDLIAKQARNRGGNPYGQAWHPNPWGVWLDYDPESGNLAYVQNDPNKHSGSVEEFENFRGQVGSIVGSSAWQAEAQAAPADSEPEPAAPDYSEFFKSPGYNFRLDEGIKARDRSAAARGRSLSGAHDLQLLRYGQGFASGEFNTYANRLAQLAGAGQQAAGSSSNLGLSAAGQGGQISANIGQGIQNAGLANASGIVGQANAINQSLGNLAFLGQQGFGSQSGGGINWLGPRNFGSPSPSGITSARVTG